MQRSKEKLRKTGNEESSGKLTGIDDEMKGIKQRRHSNSGERRQTTEHLERFFAEKRRENEANKSKREVWGGVESFL